MIGEFFKNIADNVGGTIIDGLRSLCYWLDTFIYNLIIYIYNWFVMLCNGRILDFDVVKSISDRFGLILGVFMFFTVAISFLRMILDPDKMNDKEMGMGAIVKKVILVVVMLGLSNTVFEFAYDFQKVVLGNNASGTSVIKNLLSPYKVDSRDFGAVLSTNLFTSFYDVEEEFEEKFADSYQEISDCRNYHTALKNSIMTNHKFSLGYNCLNVKIDNVSYGGVTSGQTSSEYVMRFESILSVIVGVFVLWMIFSYTIKVGVRMVQLTFLEIISPMAIISYLSPKKDTMFSKWGKIYISTYIDVFIRVAIINLVVYLISVILDGWSTGTGYFWDSLNVIDMTGTTKMYIGIIMILALLTFAQRAPELLKEILPSGGPGSIGFGVGAKDNAFGMGFLSKGAGVLTGAVGGLAGGLAAGSIGGAAFGLLRGGVGGLKNKKLGDALKSATGGYNAQKSASLRTAQRIAEGGSRFVLPGAQRRANDYDSQIAKIDSQVGFMDTAEKEAESKALKNASNYVSYNGNSLSLLAKLKDDQSLTSQQRDIYEQEYKATLKAAKEFNLAYGRDVKNGEVWFDNGGSVTAIDVAGTTYSSPNDINSHVNDLGDANVIINANMDALGVGPAGAGRYAAADSEVTKLKTQRTKVVTSEEYRRAKTDAKYSGGGKH